jgi:hypothetical protein
MRIDGTDFRCLKIQLAQEEENKHSLVISGRILQIQTGNVTFCLRCDSEFFSQLETMQIKQEG